jgi:hypothetical protein
VTNANAALRFLTGDSPNLTETDKALRRITRDGSALVKSSLAFVLCPKKRHRRKILLT